MGNDGRYRLRWVRDLYELARVRGGANPHHIVPIESIEIAVAIQREIEQITGRSEQFR